MGPGVTRRPAPVRSEASQFWFWMVNIIVLWFVVLFLLAP